MFNLNNIVKSKIGVVLGALLMCFSISAFVMAVWNNPTCDPTDDPSACNIPAPISVKGGTMTGILNIEAGGGDALSIKQGGDLIIYNTTGGYAKLYVDTAGELFTPNNFKVSGNLEVTSLTSCDCVKTDANGKLSCTACGGGDQNLSSVLAQGSDASSFTGITKLGGDLTINNNHDGNLRIGDSSGSNAQICLNGECFTKADLMAAGGGESSCPIFEGIFFDNGGDPFYCQKKVINSAGYVVFSNINAGEECDFGKKCDNGICVEFLLTWFGSSYTEKDCLTAGGTVFDTGVTGTICRFSGTDIGCPTGWTQADCWQKYSVNTWDGDGCSLNESYGPTHFGNILSETFWKTTGYRSASNCWEHQSDWHENSGPSSTFHVGSAANSNLHRVEIGCY